MMPTFAELAGVSIPKHTDGISMVPTLLGKGAQKKHEYLYWELGGRYALRMGKWKAVIDKKNNFELFDLSKDIGEQDDIAAQHTGLVKKVRAIMKASHTETPWTTWEYSGPLPESTTEMPERRRKNGKHN